MRCLIGFFLNDRLLYHSLDNRLLHCDRLLYYGLRDYYRLSNYYWFRRNNDCRLGRDYYLARCQKIYRSAD